jgi:hypothetical protein
VDGLGRRIFSENDTHLGLIQVAKPDGQGSRGWRQIVNSQLHLGSSASSARFGGVETPYDWDTPRRSILCFFFWAGYHLMWLDGSEGQLTDFCEVAIGWSWNTGMSGENLQGSHMKSPFCPPSLRRNGGNPLAQHANSQFEKFQAGWWFQTFLWANCTATSARLVSSVNIQEPGF